MDEVVDRIALLKDTLDELEQSKAFPLQYKIVYLTLILTFSIECDNLFWFSWRTSIIDRKAQASEICLERHFPSFITERIWSRFYSPWDPNSYWGLRSGIAYRGYNGALLQGDGTYRWQIWVEETVRQEIVCQFIHWRWRSRGEFYQPNQHIT